MIYLITGAAGFIGSHMAEHFSKKGKVICVDNLFRSDYYNVSNNWEFLKSLDVELYHLDIRNYDKLKKFKPDVIIHTAAQTAVTSSLENPILDFEINALGTMNILELARKNKAMVLYCSTNKVYADGHTPYGCSKLSGDLYVQDYAKHMGIKTGVFRMSCIYGTRQYGVSDQGWISWFVKATLDNKPITIYGDGKQIRDVLYVTDLVNVFDKFIQKEKSGVFDIGGGNKNKISLLELLDLIEKLTDKRSEIKYEDWRPSDQKVYISDISKAKKELNWKPSIGVEEGVSRLIK